MEGIECNQCQHISKCRHAVEDFRDSDLDEEIFLLSLSVRDGSGILAGECGGGAQRNRPSEPVEI